MLDVVMILLPAVSHTFIEYKHVALVDLSITQFEQVLSGMDVDVCSSPVEEHRYCLSHVNVQALCACVVNVLSVLV